MRTQAPLLLLALPAVLLATGCAQPEPAASPGGMSDDEIVNLVRHSYPYVAMYNVNNKFALKQGGWNTIDADTELKDHTLKEIARPNNDTLYIICMLDLRKEPVILDIPAFGSDYTSLMITAYDHYVTVPMSTRVGDFEKPEKMLVYSGNTQGYDGEEVDGIDRYYQATGDFVSAVFRVMPHSGDPERFAAITERMEDTRLVTLSELRGGEAIPIDDVDFPPVGATDFDVFENNLLEVMQFVFNHTALDPTDPIDQEVLAVYEPLGVEPGKTFDPSAVAVIDGSRIRETAEEVFREEIARMGDPGFAEESSLHLFRPKGEMSLDLLVLQSITGPIGLPAQEAVYPPIVAADGATMNAQNDYVIRMASDELPPATAFWSVTLYDLENGFFIPNERKKYSVGQNAGMQLDDDGGIAIYIAAEQPEGVPEENWLPIERKDEDLSVTMRIYAPDLERYEVWTPPRAEIVSEATG
jgi:hypothetical protein